MCGIHGDRTSVKTVLDDSLCQRFQSLAFTRTAFHTKTQGRERQRAHLGYGPMTAALHQRCYIALSPLRIVIDPTDANDVNSASNCPQNDVSSLGVKPTSIVTSQGSAQSSQLRALVCNVFGVKRADNLCGPPGHRSTGPPLFHRKTVSPSLSLIYEFCYEIDQSGTRLKICFHGFIAENRVSHFDFRDGCV